MYSKIYVWCVDLFIMTRAFCCYFTVLSMQCITLKRVLAKFPLFLQRYFSESVVTGEWTVTTKNKKGGKFNGKLKIWG